MYNLYIIEVGSFYEVREFFLWDMFLRKNTGYAHAS